MHPDILEHVDLSQERIEAGDMVVVMQERGFIKQFKHLFVNWREEQIQVLDIHFSYKISGFIRVNFIVHLNP